MSSCSNFESQMCSLLKQILAVLQTQGSELLGDVANITESVVPGTGSDNLGKEEDATHASGDTGVMMLGVRNDANIALTNANFDYSPISVDSAGRIKFDGTSFTIGNIGSITTSVTPGTAAANLGKAEDAPHTSGDVGVMALAVRANTPAAITSGDGEYSPVTTNNLGKLWVADNQIEDTLHASGDHGSFSLGVRSDSAFVFTSNNGDYSPFTVNSFGAQQINIDSDFQRAAATGILKLEDAGHTTGDAGVMALGVRNESGATLSGTELDYTPIATQRTGVVLANIDYFSIPSTASSIIKREDDAHTSLDVGVMALGVRNDDALTTLTTTNGDYSGIAVDLKGRVFTDSTVRATFTHTQPTITTATSFTLLAAAAGRRYLLVENNSAANIMINLNNGVLTGIVPTSTNLGIVLTPGGVYESPPNVCPVTAVTVYQTSGGNINTVSVVEG